MVEVLGAVALPSTFLTPEGSTHNNGQTKFVLRVGWCKRSHSSIGRSRCREKWHSKVEHVDARYRNSPFWDPFGTSHGTGKNYKSLGKMRLGTTVRVQNPKGGPRS
jgi:hypothetical protein